MAPSFSPTSNQDSFADLLSTVIVFVTGKLADEDVRYWAYLAMKPSMAKPFMEAQAKGNFQLEDFGTIIEWGKGNAPPEEVVERMRRDYAADPDYEQKLLEKLKKLTEQK